MWGNVQSGSLAPADRSHRSQWAKGKAGTTHRRVPAVEPPRLGPCCEALRGVDGMPPADRARRS
eukprot:352454-Chlamydomonas_euryale.AAC.7